MKKKLAHLIVRRHVPILAGVLCLCLLSVFGIPLTRINYDLNRYLDDRTMTKRALTIMNQEFGSSEQLRLLFENMEEASLQAAVERLNGLPEVLLAAHDPDSGTVLKDGTRYHLVTLTLNECDTAALIPRLRALFPEYGPVRVGGAAASLLDVQRRVGDEMPLVMLISLAVVATVLTLTSRAWLEPLLILLVLGLSILLNLGTNFLFPDVSFITFAVSAILQLALSIDYAIMLIHTWHEKRKSASSPSESMELALESCFMRISSSAFTTVAGLLSLLFMSFTIGFDIGLVLSKGILISMLGVFSLMPAFVLLFEKPLARTSHKSLRLGGEHLSRLIFRSRGPLAALLALVVLAGVCLHAFSRYSFTDEGHDPVETESGFINALFGSSSPLVLLVPGGENADYGTQRTLVQKLLALEADGLHPVTDVASMVTTAEAALKEYTPPEVAELTGLSPFAVRMFFFSQGFGDSVRGDTLLAAAGAIAPGNGQIASLRALMETAENAFKGKTLDRMLLTLAYGPSDNRTAGLIRSILELAEEVYGKDRVYITGVHMSAYDIGSAFSGDLLKVNLITFLAIFLIVALSFRSLRVSLLLVFVIEGAIFVTMGLSTLLGKPIFFISYLICVSIQMGATIDYGILLCDQYLSLRREGIPPDGALSTALTRALPTILTSGGILVTAGFLIGRICTVFYIADIGSLLARGTLVSVLLVLTLLPSLLLLADSWLKEKP